MSNAETNTSNTTNLNGAVDRIAFDMSDLIQSLAIANADIPEFSGRIEEDATKWLSAYERKTSTWKEAARVQQVKQYISGTAQYWFEDEIERKLPNISFFQFKKLFTDKFVDKDKRAIALRKIKSMRFNLDDNRVATFIIDFKHWYKKLNPDAKIEVLISELFEKFPLNFQCKFLNAAALEDMSSLEDFTKIAERIERSMRLEEKSSSKLMSAKTKCEESVLEKLLSEMKEMRGEINRLKEVSTRVDRTQSNQKRCFKCQGAWPACGCSSRCRTCNGSYPACGCRSARNNPNNPPIVMQSGNDNRSQP